MAGHNVVSLIDMTFDNMRFTDSLPPRAVIEARPNWVHAYGEEGRAGQDESTIRPHRRQDVIDNNTHYTVGDVWFASGKCALALMRLSGTEIEQIDIYDDDRIWTVEFAITKAEQARREVLTVKERMKAPAAKLQWFCEDENLHLLPIRYCTRLDHVTTGLPIKGKIFPDGSETDWDYEKAPI